MDRGDTVSNFPLLGHRGDRNLDVGNAILGNVVMVVVVAKATSRCRTRAELR